MKFIDAYILARTKRKTRRIRTALVVVVSSLLFSLLFAVAFIGQGMLNAGKQVEDVGFNARHLTQVTPLFSSDEVDFEAERKAVQAQMDSELKARNIKVTEATRQDINYQTELGRRLSAASAQRSAEALAKLEAGLSSLGKPTAVYHFSALSLASFARYQPDPAVDPYVVEAEKSLIGGGASEKTNSVRGGDGMNFYRAEKDMFRTQVVPGQTLDWQPGQPYPVIVPYNYLEKLADRSFAGLSAKERNQGFKELIAEYSGKELTYCYRNSTAQGQVSAVLEYNKRVAADTDKTTNPIAVPNCAGFDQKLLKKLEIISDDNVTGTKPLFPPPAIPAPDTRQIKLKIVGFIPGQEQFGTDVITQLLTSFSALPADVQLGIIPSEVVQADPLLADIAKQDAVFAYATLFADFANRADQKAFIKQGCSGADCVNSDKPYIMPFGSISVSLEGVFRFVSKFLLITASIIMVIGALMIMFTISKVIADSTKEIAVFRSLGARRRDIAQIYYTYGSMLACSALILALLLALVGVAIFNHFFEESLAQGLVQATGAYGKTVEVNFLGLNSQWLLGITFAMFIAAFIGIGIPVLASVRRKLINILREE